MNVMISGLTGAGKTTNARLISKQFKLLYVSGSTVRLKHTLPGHTPDSETFWRTSPLAEKLDLDRLNVPHADLAADEELRLLSIENSDMVFDVWPLPWISKAKAIRIWLECALETRVSRILTSAKLPGEMREQVLNRTQAKDERSYAFFLSVYDFHFVPDHDIFDLIIDTGCLEEKYGYESHKSIAAVNELINAFVRYRINQDEATKESFETCTENYPSELVVYVAPILPVDSQNCT